MSSAAPNAPLDPAAILTALRARVARLEGTGRAQHEAGPIPVCDGLPLPGGGLARAAVHEVLAAAPGCGAAFCAVQLARTGGTVLWIASGRDELLAWPPGLARYGLVPANLILVRAERWPDALWAMEEALRCPAVTGAVLTLAWEPNRQADDGELDLTASRRLQLAAETGGGLGLLLRPDTAHPAPTAAVTRWRVGPLPAAPVGQDLDDPRWQLELLRARGGTPGGPWAVTWHVATGRLESEREEIASVARAGRGASA
ncbi:MAG: hypothetical protein IRY87_08540 [Acetobacteraceae bacterium]|nr:hypothetical protein [Acetobacteraceae bacterium]